MPVVKTELQKPCSERAQDSEINSGWGGLEGWASRKVAENSPLRKCSSVTAQLG